MVKPPRVIFRWGEEDLTPRPPSASVWDKWTSVLKEIYLPEVRRVFDRENALFTRLMGR